MSGILSTIAYSRSNSGARNIYYIHPFHIGLQTSHWLCQRCLPTLYTGQEFDLTQSLLSPIHVCSSVSNPSLQMRQLSYLEWTCPRHPSSSEAWRVLDGSASSRRLELLSSFDWKFARRSPVRNWSEVSSRLVHFHASHRSCASESVCKGSPRKPISLHSRSNSTHRVSWGCQILFR